MDRPPSPSRLDKLLALSQADPSDAFCLYALGQEHRRLGSPEESLAWFARAIEADPTHAYAHFHRAEVLAALGRLAEARRQLKEGLAVAAAAGDAKAAGEIAGLLETLSDDPAE